MGLAQHAAGTGSLFVFHLGDDDGAGGVAGDVDGGTAHIKDTVDTGHQGDTLHGDIDALQHHGQHDHASAGDTGGTDGGQSGGDYHGDHLTQGQAHAAAGGQEDGGNALIDGGTVHVDGGAQRQDEGSDLVISAQLAGTVLGDGHITIGIFFKI